MIRVLVVDDHDLVRQGICALLERAEDIEVVGEADDGIEALTLIRELEPDVVVMDISMPRFGGIQAMQQIRSESQTQVVILSMYSDEALIKQAIQHGASAYILKGSDVEELILAVQIAGLGGRYFSPSISEATIGKILNYHEAPEAVSGFESLTQRERTILQLIAEGNSNRHVAETLNLSIKTIEKDRANLKTKLGSGDLASLVRVAIKHGLIFLN